VATTRDARPFGAGSFISATLRSAFTMRRLLSRSSLLSLPLVLLAALPAFAQLGPPGGMIYANDHLYRTVGTPADLPNHGTFNTIYVLGSGLANVSDAAPGDRDWRGGRWEVRPITFVTTSPHQFTNAAALRQAAMQGEIQIDDVIRRFECPLIRVPQH
jgi:hypothetical protein